MEEIRYFEKNRAIIRMDTELETAGVLLEGRAFLENLNQQGQKRILDYYEPGDIFWRSWFPATDEENYFIVAGKRCRVRLFSMRSIRTLWAIPEIRNPEEVLLRMERRRLVHLNTLGQRTLRQKLLSFLEAQRIQAGKNPFTLCMSLTDAADYLAADRSAMMRELSRMKQDGLVEISHGRILLSVQNAEGVSEMSLRSTEKSFIM